MEQEEVTASAKPAAASDDQVDVGDVWLPPPESAAAAAVVPDANGEHRSHDLSSDGEYETPV